MLLRTLVYKFLSEHLFSNLWGLDLGEELLGRMVTLCLMYSGTSKLFSTLSHSYKAPGILGSSLCPGILRLHQNLKIWGVKRPGCRSDCDP